MSVKKAHVTWACRGFWPVVEITRYFESNHNIKYIMLILKYFYNRSLILVHVLVHPVLSATLKDPILFLSI